MEWKTYRKDTFESVGSFNRTFKPWKKWQNVKLSDMCPCATCKVHKELIDRQYEVQMSGGLLEEIIAPCKYCPDCISWKAECIEKLAWYEDNDERLRKENNNGEVYHNP